MRRTMIVVMGLLMAAVSCKQQPKAEAPEATPPAESTEAKAMLQGIWVASETGEVSFRAEGDTIYYADDTSQPTYFRIVGDSIELGANHYSILKQTEHAFWFMNQGGDVVKLTRSESDDDSLAFVHRQPKILEVNEVLKIDSVVMYGGERYHWYIAINPTKYKVAKTCYNGDGVAVENIYYDNIIHISLFQGKRQLYSRDFSKHRFAGYVPESFLSQAILGNMEFDRVDAQGFHFDATLCIPDGASCYLVEALIDTKGHMTMQLIEY